MDSGSAYVLSVATGVLHGLFGLSVLLTFVAWAFARGTRSAVWLCLLLLPFRVVLPPSVGGVVGFRNLFVVPDLLIPVTFLVWFLRRESRRFGPEGEGDKADQSNVSLLPWALTLVLVAFLLSYHSDVNLRSFLSELEKWFIYVATFVLVSQVLRDRASVFNAVNVLLVGGLLATFRDLAAYLNLFHLPSPLGYTPNRDAFLLSSFDLERYQGTGWPVFVYTLFLFIFARLSLQWSSLARHVRWGLAMYGGLLLALLILSLYRGDWLALAGALGVSVLLPGVLSRKTIKAIIWLGALSVLLVGGIWGERMITGAGARLRSIFNPLQETNVLARLDAYAIAWDMFRARPLTGIGLGQYGIAFERYGGVTPFGVAVDPSYFQQANSDYFQYLATTGLVGLVALVFLFGFFLRRTYRLLRTVKDPPIRSVLLGCLLATVGFLITAVTQDPTWDKTYGVLQFAVFGIVWATARLVERSDGGPPQTLPSRPEVAPDAPPGLNTLATLLHRGRHE